MSEMNPDALAKACAKALWETDNATQALGMQLLHVEPGSSRISMMVTSNMCNGHGTCHGGYIFTLADSAFAFACNTYNQRTVAHHCNITYLSPAFQDDCLTATATEVSRDKRNGIYDIQIANQTNKIICQFRGFSRTVKGTLLSETT